MAEGDIIPPQEWLHVAVDPKSILGDCVVAEAIDMPAQSCTRSAPAFPPNACIDLTRRPTKTAIARINPALFPAPITRKTDNEQFEYVATHRPEPAHPGEMVHPAHSEIRLSRIGGSYTRNIRGNSDLMHEAKRLLGAQMIVVVNG